MCIHTPKFLTVIVPEEWNGGGGGAASKQDNSVTLVTGVSKTYCGNYFTIYTNMESLHCTRQTNIMLHMSIIIPG